MSDCCTLASAPHRKSARRHNSLIILRSAIARWFWRIRIRRERKQRSKISPVLIDDIGLTDQQAGSETTGFFWRV
ncbi:hypothetical protein GCM10010520_66120 [Rhizobium viscosum]